MEDFSFLHISDIHLDGFTLDLTPYCDDITKQDLCKNFNKKILQNIESYAISNKVDFVLIAGDVFDSKIKSLNSKLLFQKMLNNLNDNNIQVFMVLGNHDALSSFDKIIKIPTNTKIVGINTDFIYSDYIFKNNKKIAKINAVSFKNFHEKSLNLSFEKDDSVFNIGLFHTDLDNLNSDYMPLKSSDLFNLNFEYNALGHIHKRNEITKDDVNIVYSGSPQALSKKEKENHGIYHIKVKNNKIISKDFVEVDFIRFLDVDFDVSNIENTIQIVENIKNKFENLKDDILYVIDLNLSGKTNLCLKIEEETEDIKNELNKIKNIAVTNIYNSTSFLIDLSEIKKSSKILEIMLEKKDNNKEMNTLLDEILNSDLIQNVYKNDFENDKKDIIKKAKCEIENVASQIYFELGK